MFFRELPEPLFTYNHFNDFVNAISKSGKRACAFYVTYAQYVQFGYLSKKNVLILNVCEGYLQLLVSNIEAVQEVAVCSLVLALQNKLLLPVS